MKIKLSPRSREVVAKVLKEHYLTSVICDHDAKTDVACCWCTTWSSGPRPSVGEAVDAWVAHVLESIEAEATAREAARRA